MANPNSFFKFLRSTSLVFFLFLLFLNKGCALERGEAAKGYYQRVHINSLISPSASCKSSAEGGPSRKSSLEVVHKHSLCRQDNEEEPSLADVLAADQARVNSIHGINKFRDSKATILPAKSGIMFGTLNYIVNVGLGTPAQTRSLEFDTGSGLTWTQCQPCAGSCYPQQEPILDPSKSTSYCNITCDSAECSILQRAGYDYRCLDTTCVYGVKYGDQSFSVGFFSKEKLTLTSTDVFDNFLFGCGQNNRGLFGKTAGLLGLGRDALSLVSQTSQKYGKVFSYCLPTKSGSKGHLTFGKNGVPSNIKYTSLKNDQEEAFYSVDIIAIRVGGKQLPISQSVFQTTGTVVDSGTVITRLPPTAYTAMKTAFKEQMTQYPTAPAFGLLDTCYDFSNYTNVEIPKIIFTFGEDLQVDLPVQGIFVAQNLSNVCLAFAGNRNDNQMGIYGNTQQQTFEVLYDVAGGKLGFSPDGCS